MEYSNDGVVWFVWDYNHFNPLYSTLHIQPSSYIYLRGLNKNGFSFSSDTYTCFTIGPDLSTSRVAVSGNILSLIDYKQTITQLPNEYCFYGLFEECLGLKDASGLTFGTSTTILTENCYQRMFYGCTNLESVPELPATTLAPYCYSHMFYECSGLTTVPSDLLPATTLRVGCYQYMFYCCENLTTSPKLLAQKLVNSCYAFIFYDCKLLDKIECLATVGISDLTARGWVIGVGANVQGGTILVDYNARSYWSSVTGGYPGGFDVYYHYDDYALYDILNSNMQP